MKQIKYIILFIFISITLFCSSQVLNLPQRSTSAMNGNQIISFLTPLSLSAREDSIFFQVIQGNVPDFLRNLVPVSDTMNINGTNKIITYYVTPDYVALGCDSDYFLCPMTPLLAQRIADYMGYSLPTRKMVNDIWQNASVKMAPQPIAPSPQMTTVPVFADHNNMVWISRQAQIISHPLGVLVGGDKKDVVISNSIYGNPAPGRVVIYGWHQLNGSPIQPLYNGHEETYADYSHGIRLVQNEVLVEGCMSTVQQILQSPTLYPLLSDEGIINVPRYPVTNSTLAKPLSFCVLSESSGNIRIIANPDVLLKGYNVTISYDGKCFGWPEFYPSNDFNISSLIPDSIIYVKISAVGINGGNSEYSETLAAYNDISGVKHFLIVNGFDRPTTNNSYDYVIQHGKALKYNGISFSSATNDAVTDSLLLLVNFDAVDYILGEESSINETFSDEEQSIVSSYLNSSGKLFVSGSEIAWDLDHLGSVNDKAFFNNYLLSEYVEDTPNNQASTYYNSTMTAPTGSNISFAFDNGNYGIYNVRYPDVINSISPGIWTSSPLAFFDAFPNKYAGTFSINRLAYLTIPFETIYPENIRNNVMSLIYSTLFYETESQEQNTENEIHIFPNPTSSCLNIEIPNSETKDLQVQITDISGKIVFNNIINCIEGKASLNTKSFVPGIYFIHFKNKGFVFIKKFIVVQ